MEEKVPCPGSHKTKAPEPPRLDTYLEYLGGGNLLLGLFRLWDVFAALWF